MSCWTVDIAILAGSGLQNRLHYVKTRPYHFRSLSGNMLAHVPRDCFLRNYKPLQTRLKIRWSTGKQTICVPERTAKHPTTKLLLDWLLWLTAAMCLQGSLASWISTDWSAGMLSAKC